MGTVERARRAEVFSRYVGLETKGVIAAQGWSAANVARQTAHSAAALNGWLNGKRPMAPNILCEICETIGADPQAVVGRAYERMINECGDLAHLEAREERERNARAVAAYDLAAQKDAPGQPTRYDEDEALANPGA